MWLSLNVQKPKSVSASGELRPFDRCQGALPLDPAAGFAPDLRFRLALPRSPWGRATQILRSTGCGKK